MTLEELHKQWAERVSTRTKEIARSQREPEGWAKREAFSEIRRELEDALDLARNQYGLHTPNSLLLASVWEISQRTAELSLFIAWERTQ